MDLFEHKGVIIKGLLQYEWQKKDTIGVEQSSSNSSLYEHRCMGKIKKLYKYAVKCDDQQQYQAILEAAMVSIHEQFTGKFHYYQTKLSLLEIQIQVNHSVNFLMDWI